MKIRPHVLVAVVLLALPATSALAGTDCFCCDSSGLPNSDGDEVRDECDNCTLKANPSQTDSDGDGCGNVCDCDFNQDGICAIGDFSALAGAMNGPAVSREWLDICPDPPDGIIAICDFSALAGMLNGPPGPSGTTSGTTACP